MKTIIKLSGTIVISIVLSLLGVNPGAFVVSTMFTVSGIMFSLGLSLGASFNLNGVKNKIYIDKIRQNLHDITRNFIFLFAMSTFCYVVDDQLRSAGENVQHFHLIKWNVDIDFSTTLLCLILYAIAYYIINFLELRKLNEDIFDKTNK
jgi:hypothetical protein